jgi:MYXO-CTERM domain-containing protein
VAEVALVFAVFARKGQSIPMRSWRVATSFGVLVGSWMALSASPALACSPSLPVPEPTDPAKIGLDSTPPIIFDVTVDHIDRSAPNPENPCPDQLVLRVVAEDEQTPAEKLRYRVEDTSTTEPYFLFDEPVPYFIIFPPFDELRLRIYALDEAGNQSAPFAFSIDKSADEGCSMSQGSAPPSAPMPAGVLVVALAWLARRRTRDHATPSIGAQRAAGTR